MNKNPYFYFIPFREKKNDGQTKKLINNEIRSYFELNKNEICKSNTNRLFL